MRPERRVIIFFATNVVVRAQSAPLQPAIETPTSIASSYVVDSQPLAPVSLSGSGQVLLPNDVYHPITPSQRFRWFVTSTVGTRHLAGVAFTSGCGTAVIRPKDYRPHWTGYANRFLTGTAGSAASNTMEARAVFFREDLRYFRVAQRPFKARVGSGVQLTFSTEAEAPGSSLPMHAF
jgi:hypothetical protein